jgi:hypothetical protein
MVARNLRLLFSYRIFDRSFGGLADWPKLGLRCLERLNYQEPSRSGDDNSDLGGPAPH